MTDDYLRAICQAQRATAELRYGFRVVADVLAADEVVTLEEARAHLRVDAYDDPTSTASPPDQISDDDAWISAAIPAARAYCEQYLGRALATQTVEIATTGFPARSVTDPPGPAIILPFGPVQSVTSVDYLDQDAYDAAYQAAYDAELLNSADSAAADMAGVAAGNAALVQTMPSTDYEVDGYRTPNALVLAYGAAWPTSVRTAQNSVKVRYVVGYSPPGSSPTYPLPALARSAILLMLGHLYENREAATAGGVGEVPLGVHALLDFLPRERLGMA